MAMIHPAMIALAQTRPDLLCNRYEELVLEDYVGLECRYIVPTDPKKRAEFVKAHGQIVLETSFRIVGIQRDHAKRLCFRIAAISFNDRFGRCVNPKLLKVFS